MGVLPLYSSLSPFGEQMNDGLGTLCNDEDIEMATGRPRNLSLEVRRRPPPIRHIVSRSVALVQEIDRLKEELETLRKD